MHVPVTLTIPSILAKCLFEQWFLSACAVCNRAYPGTWTLGNRRLDELKHCLYDFQLRCFKQPGGAEYCKRQRDGGFYSKLRQEPSQADRWCARDIFAFIKLSLIWFWLNKYEFPFPFAAFLCGLSANVYNIDFKSFVIKDGETQDIFFQVWKIYLFHFTWSMYTSKGNKCTAHAPLCHECGSGFNKTSTVALPRDGRIIMKNGTFWSEFYFYAMSVRGKMQRFFAYCPPASSHWLVINEIALTPASSQWHCPLSTKC